MKKITKSMILKMVRQYAVKQKENGIINSDDFRPIDFYEYYNNYCSDSECFDFSCVSDDEVIEEYVFVIES